MTSKELMFYIFTTDWFYDPKNIGVKIKSPIELLAGIYQVVPFKFEKEKTTHDVSSTNNGTNFVIPT